MRYFATAVLLAVLAYTAHATYSESTAKLAVQLSAAAYCANLNSLYAWNCAPCSASNTNVNVTKVIQDTVNDINAFVGIIDAPNTAPTVVAAFRGTEPTDYKNWIVDLNAVHIAPYTNFPDVEVHKGFYEAWMNFKDQVYPDIQAAVRVSGARRVLITGHSLGGALATLCTMDLALESGFTPSLSIYTFGSPRVGNKDFSLMFQQGVGADSNRVVHYRDLVPHVPVMLMNYFHVPTEAFYNEDMSAYKVCAGAPLGEDPSCADNFDIFSVSDHLHYFGIEVGTFCNGGRLSDADLARRASAAALDRQFQAGLKLESLMRQ